jgi:acyl-[acyl carrier protein]--UDP-N-acetylglucosamine O-acyltransferase
MDARLKRSYCRKRRLNSLNRLYKTLLREQNQVRKSKTRLSRKRAELNVLQQ